MRVSVHWKDGTKWNVLCVPDFFPGEESIRPGAGHKIRHWRSSLAVGAEPVIARVRADRITLSGREGFPLSRWDLPRAA